MLLFTPAVVPRGGDPLAVLGAALPHVDVVQVRCKHPEDPALPTPARELFDWTRRVLDRVHAAGKPVPVLVNDRVDVARALLEAGVAGVHLGTDDCPPSIAREELGAEALIGLSTHDARQVATAQDEPVDYLGFGPVHATATKGYTRGLGPERAWVAANASGVPVFPIGGIDRANAHELSEVGRAAVSAAILTAQDPGAAAAHLCAALDPDR